MRMTEAHSPETFSNLLPRTFAVVEESKRQNQHHGFQLYLSRSGTVLADLGFGTDRDGIAVTPETIFPWLSSGKPLTALALSHLLQSGKISLEDPVTKFLPNFGVKGKEAITLFHLLTHTAGLRNLEPLTEPSWTTAIQKICESAPEPDWPPGSRAGYQPGVTWLLLAEIVQRMEGESFPLWIRQHLLLPLKMNHSWIGMPLEAFDLYGDRIGSMFQSSSTGLKWDPALSHKEAFVQCRPGSSACGPIRDLGKFYEFILHAVKNPSPSLFDSNLLKKFVFRQRVGMFDETFKHRIDWGLGFIMDSNRYNPETVPYGYGRHCSPQTFGHSGAQSSCAFADPAHDLVVAWVFNGRPGEVKHQQRARELNSALYEDLNLVSRSELPPGGN